MLHIFSLIKTEAELITVQLLTGFYHFETINVYEALVFTLNYMNK